MRAFLLERVPFRLPGTKGRLVWGVVVGRSSGNGLSLLYIKRPDDNWEDALAGAVENPHRRCYESAGQFVFPLGKGDLENIGGKLKALGDEESEADVRRLFDPEGLF